MPTARCLQRADSVPTSEDCRHQCCTFFLCCAQSTSCRIMWGLPHCAPCAYVFFAQALQRAAQEGDHTAVPLHQRLEDIFEPRDRHPRHWSGTSDGDCAPAPLAEALHEADESGSGCDGAPAKPNPSSIALDTAAFFAATDQRAPVKKSERPTNYISLLNLSLTSSATRGDVRKERSAQRQIRYHQP